MGAALKLLHMIESNIKKDQEEDTTETTKTIAICGKQDTVTHSMYRFRLKVPPHYGTNLSS
jgi:hypothetical protein